jgi:hypothetical protein
MFTATDAIILYALFNPLTNDYTVKIKEIISFSDYIDHAIPTYEEVSACFGRLQANGLIEVTQYSICVTPRCRQWRSTLLKKPKISIYKKLQEIEMNLNTSFTLPHAGERTWLDKTLFEKLVNAYLRNDQH